jgi:hypothetical protein
LAGRPGTGRWLTPILVAMTNTSGDGDQPEDPYRVPPQSEQPRPHGDGPAQPGYGQPEYGQPAYGYPALPAPNHGGALASLIVGIASLVFSCAFGLGLLASPVAWWLGAKAKREIDASQGRLGGRGMAQAGLILGIIGTVLLVLAIIGWIALVALSFSGSGMRTSP